MGQALQLKLESTDQKRLLMDELSKLTDFQSCGGPTPSPFRHRRRSQSKWRLLRGQRPRNGSASPGSAAKKRDDPSRRRSQPTHGTIGAVARRSTDPAFGAAVVGGAEQADVGRSSSSAHTNPGCIPRPLLSGSSRNVGGGFRARRRPLCAVDLTPRPRPARSVDAGAVPDGTLSSVAAVSCSTAANHAAVVVVVLVVRKREGLGVPLLPPSIAASMPVRRGHVAPHNTFIDSIIRKFDGMSLQPFAQWGSLMSPPKRPVEKEDMARCV
ncbi:hypothetical protein HPB47_009646 [Ixodes persulcatus]|uniref:Uncharacterized protein n=1 Tax=Ixodes persulcatus TaxID=34615 RepID=A0AC60P1L5_IXOPE|nr:hypothetical protein HPB47_009646 [Ixodes persulcatus]